MLSLPPGGIVASSARQMNVRRGMKASIPGQTRMPKASIAWLPEKDEGYIGAERPAIGRIGEVDFGKIGIPYARTVNKGNLGESPLKVTPHAQKLEVNGRTKIGFTKTPVLRNPNQEQ